MHLQGIDEIVQEAQSDDGPFRLQSAHNLFAGILTSSLSVRACRSVVALSWRLAIVNTVRQLGGGEVQAQRKFVPATTTLTPHGEERPDASINISLLSETPSMSDAKARAAARREAILAGKSDRLAKLTTKAKNEGDAAGSVRNATEGQPLLS